MSCQPIYRSLPCSILFLNFLYKRLREGERRVSEQGEDGRRKKKCHHGFHLESSANLPNRQQSQKATPCPKTHILQPGLKKTLTCRLLNPIWQHAICTHTATTLHATLAMLLSELVDTGGDVRTTKGFVVNIVIKRWGKYNVYKTPLQPVDAFVRTSRMKVAVLISKTMHYTMPNVCPTKELLKLIASTHKLRFVNQLANMQKSTFTPGQYVCGLSKSSVTRRELIVPLFAKSFSFGQTSIQREMG